MLIVSLDQDIVVIALPEIGRELGYTSQTLSLADRLCYFLLVALGEHNSALILLKM